MDYTALGFWVPVLITILLAIFGFFGWAHRQEFARQRELRDTERRLDGRIDDCDKDLAELKSTVRSLPTHQDVTGLTASVSELKATTEAMTRNLNRMEQLFLQKGVDAL